MTENENTEASEPTEEPDTQPDGEPAREPDIDWKAEARKWEQRAKSNKDATERLKELEDAQKSEQELLSERLTATEQRAAEAELRAMRLEVATDKGLTKAQAKYLSGTSVEELEAAADELRELFGVQDEPSGPPRRPQERLKPGASPSADEPFNPEELAAKVWATKRY